MSVQCGGEPLALCTLFGLHLMTAAMDTTPIDGFEFVIAEQGVELTVRPAAIYVGGHRSRTAAFTTSSACSGVSPLPPCLPSERCNASPSSWEGGAPHDSC